MVHYAGDRGSKPSIGPRTGKMDCFVASLLAMTVAVTA